MAGINRDPEVVKRQESAARRAAEDAEASRLDDELSDLAARAAAAAGVDAADQSRYTSLQREPSVGEGSRIKVSLGGLSATAAAAAGRPAAATEPLSAVDIPGAISTKRSRFDLETEAADLPNGARAGSLSMMRGPLPGTALSNLDRIVAEDSRIKQAAASRVSNVSRFDRPAPTVGGLAGGRHVAALPALEISGGKEADDDRWLLPGIVVKVLNKRVGEGRYYKAKGVVTEVQGDGFVAVVKLIDGGGVLKVDQADLQTVVPSQGGAVLIVHGRWRGERGVLLDIREEKFVASLQLARNGTVLESVEYEDFSKAAD